MIIDLATTYVYQLTELKNKNSSLARKFKKNYPHFKILDLRGADQTSNFGCLSVLAEETNEVAIIFQGSNNINDWRSDNFNNLLNKPIKQYEEALSYTQEMKARYQISYCAGNSLGGGCAQYVGTKFHDIRCLCINAAPLLQSQYDSCANIFNLRINADPLYRFIKFDQERFAQGYSGNIITIKRSCFGLYDYFNHIVIAHAGAIYSDVRVVKKHSRTSNLNTLNNIYLDDYLAFDLTTYNLLGEKTNNFDLEKIKVNFKQFLTNYHQYVDTYLFKNITDNFEKKFINYNKVLSREFKYLIKKDLLKITLKDELTYRGIYFIIDGFTRFIYHACLPQLKDALKDFDFKPEVAIIKENTKIYHHNFKQLGLMLTAINDQLLKYHDFNPFSNKIMHLTTDIQDLKPFIHDYQKLVYDNIKAALFNILDNNKTLIDRLAQFIKNVLLLRKTSENIPILKHHQLDSKDIDYLLRKYHVHDFLKNFTVYFYPDIEEMFLTNSLLYIYQSNILLAHEYLIQVKATLNNLLQSLNNAPFNLNKARLRKMITHTLKQLDCLAQADKQVNIYHDF